MIIADNDSTLFERVIVPGGVVLLLAMLLYFLLVIALRGIGWREMTQGVDFLRSRFSSEVGR